VIHVGGPVVIFPFFLFRKHLQASLVHDFHGDMISEMLMKWRLDRQKLKNAVLVLQTCLLTPVTFHRADYHLVVSRPLEKLLLAHRVPQEKIALIRNGVDIETFKPNGVPSKGPFTVCYAGAYQAWQGVDLFIEAGRKLPDLDVKLRFTGFRQTEYDRKWKDKIRKALGSKAEILDWVPLREFLDQLQSVDLFVTCRPHHPANVVSFSTKFAESLALSKPILVTDVEETAQFVRKYECGLVYKPTASGLAKAIRQAHNMDRAKLRAMGERGRRLAETTFAWNVICKQYHDFLIGIKGS
jgi:glycosyltransferase involved in cell wall biosynthesis